MTGKRTQGWYKAKPHRFGSPLNFSILRNLSQYFKPVKCLEMLQRYYRSYWMQKHLCRNSFQLLISCVLPVTTLGMPFCAKARSSTHSAYAHCCQMPFKSQHQLNWTTFRSPLQGNSATLITCDEHEFAELFQTLSQTLCTNSAGKTLYTSSIMLNQVQSHKAYTHTHAAISRGFSSLQMWRVQYNIQKAVYERPMALFNDCNAEMPQVYRWKKNAINMSEVQWHK